MIVRPYRLGDLERIEAQPAQRPFVDLVPTHEAEEVILSGPAWTGVSEGGDLIGAAGLAEGERGYRAWAVFSAAIQGRGLLLTRLVRFVLDSTPRPVVALVIPSHREAARFARVVGFEFVQALPETPPLGVLHLYARG